MTTFSFTADGELADVLEDAENRSELIRDALRSHVGGRETDTEGLTDLQRQGLAALLELSTATDGAADGRIEKEYAESKLAQRTQVDSEVVVSRLIKPLMRAGHVRLANRRQSLNVYETPRQRDYEAGGRQWTPVPQSKEGRTCDRKHGLLPDGATCPVCGVETADDGDEQDSDEEPVSLDTTATECETPGCTATLYGGVSTCWDCRTGTEGSA